MNIELYELRWYPVEKTHKHITLFSGKVDSIHFNWGNELIKPPQLMFTHGDIIRVCYPDYSNVKVTIESKDGHDTAWCEPAITQEELTKLIEERKQQEIKRKQLSVLEVK
jgi:hypothetical protein